MEKNISTIIFDFGNVLIDLDIPGFYKRMKQLTGLSKNEDVSTMVEISKSYEQGKLSTELFINQIIKSSRHSIQAREIIKTWNSMLIGIRPEVLALLKDLKPHYRIYILSNTNPLHIQWANEHLHHQHNVENFETEYLHGVFYSHRIRLIKPHPEIYTYVQNEIGISSDEILYLDDMEVNVVGARNAGWTAIIHPP